MKNARTALSNEELVQRLNEAKEEIEALTNLQKLSSHELTHSTEMAQQISHLLRIHKQYKEYVCYNP